MILPSNSNTSREPDDKKVQSVVVNPASRRKKPLGKRFMETFVAGDPKQVASYVVFEVLLPSAKDMLVDAFQQALDKWLYPDGGGRSTTRRPGVRAGLGSFVSYNRFHQASSPMRREEERRPVRATHGVQNFDQIVLATRPEADAVIDGLFQILNDYKNTSVADLCELAGITADPVAYKWGWTNLQGSRVQRISEGYLLDLPQPEPL